MNVTDLCGLAPPEPLERILVWLDAAEPDEVATFRLPHVPYPLFDHLTLRPCCWDTTEQADGTALVRIVRQ
ncbi:DUF2249 domain-containing protein [Chitinilyticum piscinae]|uniref:DUF2249 domain-containing protein n=1 Tax=Chitinilyticum piscinae TaxID=2866724 RepID=A0A8J7FQM3_9NEIS|nr:DUF2249 domain-containing protein [Chitinilyticum piscinae]MBE9610499.1 DUF2249 domain-containing protein [Chitinilyticum piscinae]